MTQLGPQLPPWMVVCILFFMVFAICFPAFGQVNTDSLHLLRSGDTLQHRQSESKLKAAGVYRKKLLKEINESKSQVDHISKSFRQKRQDTLPESSKPSSPKRILSRSGADSLQSKADSAVKHLAIGERDIFYSKVNSVKRKLAGLFTKRKTQKPDSLQLQNSFDTREHLFSTPILKFGGGYISYGYSYRSSVDTPFAEQNIRQQNINGTASVVIAKNLPLRVNFWIRRSNSVIYQDITDIQVSFDAAEYRNHLMDNMRRRLMAFAPSLNDSALEKLTALRLLQLGNTYNWLLSPVNIQRIHESRELIQINTLHPESRPTDSSAQQQLDLQLKEAAIYIQFYDSSRAMYDTLKQTVDSLQYRLSIQKRKLDQFRQILSTKPGNWSSYTNWKGELDKRKPEGLELPDKYKWLMGIRNFSVGKTPVNYSELSAKNISLTGVNFEYNSWYYLAATAGLIDYRFRDFVVSNVKRSPQYLYMLRAGLGRIEKNYFILSLFRGQKQLYNLPATSQIGNSINVTGVTAETKWQANAHTYIVAEAGESLAPDYRTTPVQPGGKFTLKGNTNKALSVKFYSGFPKLGARAEGMYKYTGANYQSFSSYQTNAAVKSWYVKWEQNFFSRKLRITGSLRSNEFTNPYILQNYKSNTIFKSVNAVFRMRKLPVVSFGYMPMSQLSIVGQQVVENRFQTMTVSVNHFYKLGNKQAVTTLVYNRFFNTNTDSGFIYFNASNFYLSQNIIFKLFTAGLTIADSKSSQYHLTAGEINVRVPLLKKTVLGMGVKINNLNQQETRIGNRFNIDLSLTSKDRIGINYEKSYLPGTDKQLINSEMGNIQYSRYF